VSAGTDVRPEARKDEAAGAAKAAEARDPEQDRTWLLIAGGLAVVFLFLGYYLIGIIQHDGEARARLTAAIPTIRFFASAVITAAATILALMLTLLGFTQSHDGEFTDVHFQRVRRLAKLSVSAMIGGVFLMMLLTMPVTEAEQMQGYYTVAYYVIVGAAALLGGWLVAIALLLQRAVSDLIGLLDPDVDSRLVRSRPD
jgi:hypothetical protein